METGVRQDAGEVRNIVRKVAPGTFQNQTRAGRRPPPLVPELASRIAALNVLQGVLIERRAVDDTFDTAVKDLAPRDVVARAIDQEMKKKMGH